MVVVLTCTDLILLASGRCPVAIAAGFDAFSVGGAARFIVLAVRVCAALGALEGTDVRAECAAVFASLRDIDAVLTGEQGVFAAGAAARALFSTAADGRIACGTVRAFFEVVPCILFAFLEGSIVASIGAFGA